MQSKKTQSILFLLVTIMTPSFLRADTTDHPFRTAAEDGIYLFSFPSRFTRKDIPVAAGVGASLGGLVLLDRTLRNHLFPWQNTDPSEDLRHWGDYSQSAGPVIGTLFAVQGSLTNNAKSKETALLSYESFVWAAAAEGAIKFVVGRKRPSDTDNPFHFHPGRTDSSFPSGHTTVAFAAATVYAEQYPKLLVIVPAYAAAATVGFSRLYANKHWLSDVVAGAAFGTTVSHFIRQHHLHSKKSAWEFEFDGSAARWVRHF